MRLGRIGTRYAAWIAALSLALLATALLAAGFIGFRQSRVVQAEIHAAVDAARTADEEAALRGTARYLGTHFFNALYQLDVQRLDEEIQEVRVWLPITSFIVLDNERCILTDGTPVNGRYGEVFTGELPGEGRESLLLTRRGEETEIRFNIASGGVQAGWGVVTVAAAPWQASLRRLEQRTAASWHGHRASLLSLGAIAFVVTLGLGLLTAVLLSRSLARPLTEMSRAAGEFAAGHLDHPLTLDPPDELGDLARALNRMAGDLRAHEEALRVERADLAAKNAELERFNYTVSHDLKSPLVTIRGFAGLAGTDLGGGRPDRVRQDLGRIVAAADRMTRLLDELLELSRVGRVVQEAEDVPLGELAREAVDLVKGPLEARGVAVEIVPGLPIVRGDRRRLLEVYQNLLENATKFASGDRDPRVEIGVRHDGVERVFFVRDNGRGIDPRFLERVFELFEKLDPGVEGTGVGLALVRRIVEAHGGRAWAESDGAGRGATFCFTLPQG
ncbi:MAG TPA: HAMP domain-containing sensor histidine kinase [Vicinamibacteria bacterium]|nr:HAMP domain-containing sensor histidine kinase [Vicinamibacteria bacterium]